MTSDLVTSDTLIVGGGVIGLSIAYELLTRGQTVTIVDRNDFGRKASWAGAGMLPPVSPNLAVDPVDQLCCLSNRLHPIWAERLQEATGIDNGFRKCGAITIARTAGEVAALTGKISDYESQNVECHKLSADELVRCCPPLTGSSELSKIHSSMWVPGEAQICNPHHLEALEKVCRSLGANLHPNVDGLTWQISKRSVLAKSSGLSFESKRVCLVCGPWASQVASQMFPSAERPMLPTTPVRGQMLLFKLKSKPFDPVLSEGPRYLVTRDDGYVLVGSTVEEVGFDESTTEAAIANLKQFANKLIADLNEETFVKCWAGLRPATYDGLPYLGSLPRNENVFVAAGHFRWGLQQSTGTASVIADLMEKKEPEFSLELFSPARTMG